MKMADRALIQCVVFMSMTWLTSGQATTVSQTGCSYTFLVSKQQDSSCPAGSVTTGSDNDEKIDYLQSVVALLSQNFLKLQEQNEKLQEQNEALTGNFQELQEQNEALTENVQELQEQVESLESTQGSGAGGGSSDVRIGTNYVRWGRTMCPQTAELLYEGYAAKSDHLHTGGGANYICLDKDPEWPDVVKGDFQSGGHIYGVEYEALTGLNGSLHQNDAPCAVCHVEGRGEHLMIPGKRTCPSSWTKEYEGLLVSQHITYKKATYVCLDGEPEVIPGGSANNNGGLFYTVEARCGSLPCPPYGHGYEISCVVCTH